MPKTKTSFFTRPVIFFLSLTLLCAPFSFYPTDACALSTEAEAEMGREFVIEVKRHFELLDDDFANEYFSSLGGYLLKSVETKNFDYTFYIIKDKTLNAFAAPGGHIFFFSGLIDSMDRVDELASILCHEIGHVSARHMANRMEQGKKIGIATLAGILAGVLIGGDVAGAMMVGSMAAGIQAQLHYSREDERQADQLGFKYTANTGLNPDGLSSTLNKLEKANLSGSNDIPPYLLTHPTGPERMANIDDMLSRYPSKTPGKKDIMFREYFPMFQAIVRAKCLEPEAAQKLFTLELKKDPNSASAHLGLGIMHAEKQEYALAIGEIKRAQEIKPNFAPILSNLGKVYQLKGEDQTAITVLEKALTLSPEDNSIFYLLGISHENMEQYEKAIRFFERLTAFRPVRDDVYYHLGMSYGRLDNLKSAHYNFGLYFKKIGEIEKAMFHFNKALENVGNDAPMKKKIETEQKELSERPHPIG